MLQVITGGIKLYSLNKEIEQMVHNIELVRDTFGSRVKGLEVVGYEYKGVVRFSGKDNPIYDCDLQLMYACESYMLFENAGRDGQSVRTTLSQWQNPLKSENEVSESVKEYIRQFGQPKLIDLSGRNDIQPIIGQLINSGRVICSGPIELGVILSLQHHHLFFWVDGDEGFFGWSTKDQWIVDRGYAIGREI
jgi:hypothetical protein